MNVAQRFNSSRRILRITSILGVAVCALAGTLPAQTWHYSVIDSSVGNFNGQFQLALSGNGVAGIAYADGSDIVFSARSPANTWSPQTVFTSPLVGLQAGLAFGAGNNTPKVAFALPSTDVLEYSAYNGTAWPAPGLINTAGTGHSSFSLAANSTGNPSISYFNSATGLMQFGTFASGNWTTGNIGNSTYADVASSVLAINNSGNASVLFSNTANSNLYYGSLVSGNWTVSQVMNGSNPVHAGRNVSLTLDSSGNPWIAFADTDSLTVQVGNLSGNVWSFQTAASYAGLAIETSGLSLALTSGNDPLVAFNDPALDALQIATYASGNWTVNPVAPGSDVAGWVSMILDADGNPMIAYYDLSSFDLAFATTAAPVPEPGTMAAAMALCALGAAACARRLRRKRA